MSEYYEEPKEITEEHNRWKEQLLKSVEDTEYYLLDCHSVRALSAGDQPKRVKRLAQQHTISIPTIERWEDFLTILSGMPPQRGRGISSSMVEVAIKLLMAVYTEVDIERVAMELVLTLNSRKDVHRLVENLETLITEMNKMAVE